jgi:hypothetical protein
LGARGVRPREVTMAVAVCWFFLALSLINWVIKERSDPPDPMDPGLPGRVPLTALMYAVPALVIVKVAAGRNWARRVLLIQFAASLPGAHTALKEFTWSMAAILRDVQLTGVVFKGAIVWLLFGEPGKRWFSPVDTFVDQLLAERGPEFCSFALFLLTGWFAWMSQLAVFSIVLYHIWELWRRKKRPGHDGR